MSNVHLMKPIERQSGEPYASPAEKIYFEWDKALSQNDAAALLELYATDGVIESPLIPYVLGKQEGVCSGRDEMRPFFEAVAVRKPPVRQYYRTGYLTDGKRLIFEYPRAAENGTRWTLSKLWNSMTKG